MLYSILNKESVNSLEKFQIKSIVDWNRNKIMTIIYYFQDKNKDLGRSLWDITDLEVWRTCL